MLYLIGFLVIIVVIIRLNLKVHKNRFKTFE